VRWLGLDVGSRTIGLAICDEQEVVATPLRTLERRGGDADLEAVAAVMQETESTALLLGLPLEMSGAEGDAVLRVRRLGQRLTARLACPLEYWDERFSTVAAERALLEANVRRSKRRKVINHVAASLILQSFIDARGRKGPEAPPRAGAAATNSKAGE
jgi:putative pre-16S rRNA nuclease